jgi:hypothetical protein
LLTVQVILPVELRVPDAGAHATVGGLPLVATDHERVPCGTPAAPLTVAVKVKVLPDTVPVTLTVAVLRVTVTAAEPVDPA